jgi:hypothetical protein
LVGPERIERKPLIVFRCYALDLREGRPAANGECEITGNVGDYSRILAK